MLNDMNKGTLEMGDFYLQRIIRPSGKFRLIGR